MEFTVINCFLGMGLSATLLLGLSLQPTTAQTYSQNTDQTQGDVNSNSNHCRHNGHSGHGDCQHPPKKGK